MVQEISFLRCHSVHTHFRCLWKVPLLQTKLTSYSGMSPGLLYPAQIWLLTLHDIEWSSPGSRRRGPGWNISLEHVSIIKSWWEFSGHFSWPVPLIMFPLQPSHLPAGHFPQICMAGKGSSMTQIISFPQRGYFLRLQPALSLAVLHLSSKVHAPMFHS